MGGSRRAPVATVALLCCLAAAATSTAHAAKDSQQQDKKREQECAALGFAPTLSCGTCKKIGAQVGDDHKVVGECQGCCTDSGAVSYIQGRFEVCN